MSKFIQNILRPEIYRSTWRRVIHLWKPMAGWTLLVWAFIAAILTPISSAVLGLQFFRSGNLVIGNEELISWLFSAAGIAYLLLSASLILTGWALQFAGIFQIVANDIHQKTIHFRHLVWRTISHFHVLFRLCLSIVSAGLLLLIPLAAGLGMTYELLLDTYDINYYLSETPLEWHIALIISITWFIIWMIFAAYLTARCLFAIPAYLHSQKSIRESITYAWEMGLRKSKEKLTQILSAAGFWIIIQIIANILLLALSIWITNAINDQIGSLRIIALITGLYVLVTLAVDAILSFLGFSFVSTLITKLYFRDFRKPANAPPARPKFKKLASFLQKMLRPKPLASAGIILVILSFFLSGYMLGQIPPPNPNKTVKIAAHRAGPPPAPENSLEALDLTLKTGAELAEIDVQLTRDSVVVVSHDFDLMRMIGNPARIADNSFENLQKIVGDRHPLHTLDEFLSAAKNKIQLMVELKKPDSPLIRSVISAVRQHEMEEEIIILSMSPDAVRQIKNIAPEITVGYISALSLGNINRLPVELLAVNYRSVTNQLVSDAHQQNLEVYAWTVNRANLITTMIERNVDGIITDDPELAIQVRNEMQELTAAERLLLQFHQFAR